MKFSFENQLKLSYEYEGLTRIGLLLDLKRNSLTGFE